jgi:hypothetical protein
VQAKRLRVMLSPGDRTGPFGGSCVFYGLCEPQKTHGGGEHGLRGFHENT